MKDLGIEKINSFPTVIDNNHESLYRAYQILELVKELLLLGTPSEVVLAILVEFENMHGV
jgi:hypothetical protein